MPRPEDWQVLLTGHHPGYIDWDTYLASTARLAANMAPVRGADGTGATREGCALLQGLAICGICGRRLGVFYRGPAKSIPGYQCNGGVLVGGGQGRFCTRVSGLRTDPAVAQHVLEVLTPLALQAAIEAADQLEAGHDAALDQWRRQAGPAIARPAAAPMTSMPSARRGAHQDGSRTHVRWQDRQRARRGRSRATRPPCSRTARSRPYPHRASGPSWHDGHASVPAARSGATAPASRHSSTAGRSSRSSRS